MELVPPHGVAIPLDGVRRAMAVPGWQRGRLRAGRQAAQVCRQGDVQSRAKRNAWSSRGGLTAFADAADCVCVTSGQRTARYSPALRSSPYPSPRPLAAAAAAAAVCVVGLLACVQSTRSRLGGVSVLFRLSVAVLTVMADGEPTQKRCRRLLSSCVVVFMTGRFWRTRLRSACAPACGGVRCRVLCRSDNVAVFTRSSGSPPEDKRVLPTTVLRGIC